MKNNSEINIFSDTIIDKKIIIADEIKAIMQKAHTNIINLEAPFVTENLKPARRVALYQLSMDLSFFKNNNIEYVTLANNHMMDYGLDGLLSTIDLLKNNNITYFGAGKNEHDANQVIILTINNKKILLWAAASFITGAKIASAQKPGVASIENINTIFKDIKRYDIDYMIALLHFGTEYEDYPEPYFKRLTEDLCHHYGFNLVIGHHPHCIQGMKKVNNSSICYSMGNFIFPETYYHNHKTKFKEKSKIGYFINLTISDTFNVKVVPYEITNNGYEIRCIAGRSNDKFQKYFDKISYPLNLNDKEYSKFYKRVRIRKNRPVLTKNLNLNKFIFSLFMFYKKIKSYLGVYYRFVFRTKSEKNDCDATR